jgi:hypothetical protein
MHTIFIIFSFYALTHAIKESWLFNKPRVWLIGLHPFFYFLFECYACVGLWSGFVVYALDHWKYGEIFLWGLAASGISFLFNVIVEKLLK